MYWMMVAGAWFMVAVWLGAGFLLYVFAFLGWFFQGGAAVPIAIVLALMLLLWTGALMAMFRWLYREGRKRGEL